MILDRFTASGPWLVYGVSVVLILCAGELGRRLGVRDNQRDGAPAEQTVGQLESALFTILALMVGFSFAVALTRFDARRDAILQEANAIGTAALRTQVLAPQPATASLALMRDYVRIRLDLVRNPRSPTLLDKEIGESSALQQKLWRIAVDASAGEPRSVSIGLYIQSLNAMIDLQETRLMAARNQVPNIVFMLLYVIAAAAIGFAGYGSGLCGSGVSGSRVPGSRVPGSGVSGPRGRVPIALMGVLVATVIGLIVDIDYPRSGLLAVSQQPMLDVAASLGM
jgi:hypothetical protein